MPQCLNININGNIPNQNPSSQNGEGYTGDGSGNRVLDAAMKYYDKFMPRGATGNNGTYYCNALIGCTLEDLGLWKGYSNANNNSAKLKKDSRFVEIKYTSGEKAMPGDIMCIERSGKSGHNMIAHTVNSEGRVTKCLSAGSASDPKGRNHVGFINGYPKAGTSDYNNLHLFRLK